MRLENENTARIVRTRAASLRLDAARKVASDRDLASAVDYIRGWLDSAGRCAENRCPEEILDALAYFIERENKKRPKQTPSAACNVGEYLNIAAGGHRCTYCGRNPNQTEY